MIDANSAGQLQHGPGQFFALRIDAVGCPELPSPVKFGRHDIGGDDFGGAAQARALNDVHSVTAAAHHQHAFARLHPCPLARSSDAGRHAACNQARKVERDVLVDNDDGGLIHDGAFGKGADHAEGADRDAVAVAPAVGTVELGTLGDTRTFGTQVMQALPAPVALSASRDKGENDVIAGLDAANSVADFFDHAGGLMAEHHRPHGDPPLAAHDVIIRAAQPHRGNAYQHFGGPRRIQRDALDRDGGTDFTKNSRKRFHPL